MNVARTRAIMGVLVLRCLRDPGMVAMLVLVPLVAALVFGLADQRANDSLPVGLVRTDSGALAGGLVGQIRGERELRVRSFSSVDDLKRALRQGDVYAGVVVPNDYDRRSTARLPTRLEIVGDRSQSTFVAAHAALALVVDRENQTLGVARALASERQTSVAAMMADARRVVAATPVRVARRTADSLTSATGLGRSVPGMLVFFVFAISMGYALTLFDDRRRGVLTRAATTRATDTEIIGGEIAGRCAISVVQAVLIVAVSAFVLGVRWGDPLGVAAVILLFSMVSACAAVIVGCGLAGTLEQGVWLTDGLMALLGVLGGCFFSLRLVPAWVRTVAHVSPHAWAVDAFDRLVATNGGVVAIAPTLVVLAGFAIVLFALAVRQLRRALES